MNKIERMKLEKNSLAVLHDIYRFAKGTLEEIPEDDFARMRSYGLFYRKREGGFMIRVRIPSGQLTGSQALQLANIAERYSDGNLAITTRMGVQIRKLALSDLPEVLQLLNDAGLDSRQSGLDNVRNLMNCPVAGLRADEAFDASDIVQGISKGILGNASFSDLPRKFNISVTGCHEDCAHSRLNDVGLVPQIIHLEEGVKQGFRIRLGGAIGKLYTNIGEDIGVWIPKDEAVDCVMSLLDIFRKHGNRENRNKARMFHLVEEMGLERMLELLAQRLGQPLREVAGDVQENMHTDHIGIHQQKQPGNFYAGLSVPNGKITSSQFRELARLADIYGQGDIRLTAGQNVIIPHIPETLLKPFKNEALLKQFSYSPSPFSRGLVSCTGKEGCDLAIVDTKTPALKLISELEERLIIKREELRIHWSGCPNSCAIIQTGDIGLRGTKTRWNGELVDAVDVFYGGKIGHHAQLGTLIRKKVPVEILTEELINILTDEQYFTDIYLKITEDKFNHMKRLVPE